jgi:hypothetical protein
VPASEIIYVQLRGAKAAILADDRAFRSGSGSEKGQELLTFDLRLKKAGLRPLV